MMWHDVVRVLFPGLLSDLHGPLYLAIEEERIAAGLSPYLKKCLTGNRQWMLHRSSGQLEAASW